MKPMYAATSTSPSTRAILREPRNITTPRSVMPTRPIRSDEMDQLAGRIGRRHAVTPSTRNTLSTLEPTTEPTRAPRGRARRRGASPMSSGRRCRARHRQAEHPLGDPPEPPMPRPPFTKSPLRRPGAAARTRSSATLAPPTSGRPCPRARRRCSSLRRRASTVRVGSRHRASSRDDIVKVAIVNTRAQPPGAGLRAATARRYGTGWGPRSPSRGARGPRDE